MNRNTAIRELHVLMRQCNIDEDGKQAIYASYHVESSKDMNLAEIRELCNKLHEMLQKDGNEKRPADTPLDRQRRSTKVAVGKLLAAQGKIPGSGWGIVEWNLIRGTVCRAAGVDDFNAIPMSKLRGLTFEFNKQAKAIAEAKQFIQTN